MTLSSPITATMRRRAGALSEFGFSVLPATSRLTFRIAGRQITTPYDGDILVDPITGEPIRIVIRMAGITPSDGLCRTHLKTLDYGNVRSRRQRVSDARANFDPADQARRNPVRKPRDIFELARLFLADRHARTFRVRLSRGLGGARTSAWASIHHCARSTDLIPQLPRSATESRPW